MSGNDTELERLRREVEYCRSQLDELGAKDVKNDFLVTSLRREVKQRRQGFAALTRLQSSFTPETPLGSILEMTVVAITDTLEMDKSVLLTPTGTGLIHVPARWAGFPPSSADKLQAARIEFPPELLAKDASLLVTKVTPPTPFVESIRAALDLPHFICLPVHSDRGTIGVLVCGRQREGRPFFPPLDLTDIDSLRAIASLIAASIQNVRIVELNRELRRQIFERSRSFLESVVDANSPAPRSDRELSAGDRIAGIYTVTRPIGKGGMGAVYEVVRDHDGARFAGKLLLTDQDREWVARFAREAEMLARLDHPNLVSVVDVDFSQRGSLCIIMELVEGSPLTDLITNRPSLPVAISVLRQIATALAAVHELGIVHRDLKPSNVLCTTTPATGHPLVKLVDFGIAVVSGPSRSRPPPAPAAVAQLADCAVGSGDTTMTLAPAATVPAGRRASAAAPPHASSPDRLTRTGMIVGTPLYMAPELAAGVSGAAPSADLFSLGILAYELLTGQHPFGTPPILVPRAEWQMRVDRAMAALPEVDVRVAELIRACLDADPRCRPEARGIAATLASYLGSAQQRIPPPTNGPPDSCDA